MFPKKLLPLAMKGMYLTYIRHTKTSNPKSLPRVNFLVACITDVFGMNVQLAYEIAFTYIRQLAMTLRTAISGKAKVGASFSSLPSFMLLIRFVSLCVCYQNSTGLVCSWPFVNALRCWGQVFSQYSAKDELGLLVYPYIQVSIFH
jgi:nucleolar complex protein 2